MSFISSFTFSGGSVTRLTTIVAIRAKMNAGTSSYNPVKCFVYKYCQDDMT